MKISVVEMKDLLTKASVYNTNTNETKEFRDWLVYAVAHINESYCKRLGVVFNDLISIEELSLEHLWECHAFALMCEYEAITGKSPFDVTIDGLDYEISTVRSRLLDCD